MSSNDQYIIREVGHNIYDLFHVDVDTYIDDLVIGAPLKKGLHGLRTAVRAAEEERVAEYGYAIEFLEEE